MTRLKISLFSGICMHLKKFGRYAKYPSFYLKPKCIIHTDVCVCSATRELHFPEKQKKKTIFVQKRQLAKNITHKKNPNDSLFKTLKQTSNRKNKYYP